jgi:GNAT superfamily N-acetyltransferase
VTCRTLKLANVGKPELLQIGLARVITDYVTFAYLTDVYVLAEYQKKGLGSWLIKCVNEAIESWPTLRGMGLICATSEAKWYEKLLGMKILQSIKGHEVNWMIKDGPGR